ncbi:Fur family transcriptional regulator [Branchiibius cervicis]|uniref:Fur family transcriptional regulator n=1 Tax=Branchiibius cervicis TaxID=908252 RepID=A0ABW2AMZ1_9MICO
MSEVEQAIAQLRAHGERVTPARRAILAVLRDDPRHLDAETIATQVADREPGVHRATVYRSLQALSDCGVVTHTHVPSGATIYHLAQSAPQHAHLQCERCEKFFDVPAEWLDQIARNASERYGFAIDRSHAALLGVCADCAVHE